MDVTTGGTCIGLAHEFGQLDVGHLARGLSGKGVSHAIENDSLAGLGFKGSSIADTCHRAREAVLGIRPTEAVEKDVVGGFVGVAGQPAAHLEDRWGQRNDAGLWLPLSSDGLVVRKNPIALFEVDPVPNEVSKFAWAAARLAQGHESTAEARVAVAQQGEKIGRGDDTSPHPGPGLDIAHKGVLDEQVVSNGPGEDGLDSGDGVLDRGGAFRLEQCPFDASQVELLQLADTKLGADDPQAPEQPVAVALVSDGLLSGLDVVEELVDKLHKGHIGPIVTDLLLPFLVSTKLAEFTQSGLVVLVEVDALAVDRSAPVARSVVEPGLDRALAWHDEPPKKKHVVTCPGRSDVVGPQSAKWVLLWVLRVGPSISLYPSSDASQWSDSS
jgi:hypothetical protein